jgi:two-component system sensor histidine kinase and response regulator WspE
MSTNSASGPDPEILELFRSELDTHLPVLSSGLLALEKEQVNESQIEAMMRAAHSIKGAARIVGIDPAVKVAHALEDCFSAAKSKKIALTSDSVDVLLEGVDALQQICSPGDRSGAEPLAIEPLLHRIGDVGGGKSAPSIRPKVSVESNPAGNVSMAARRESEGVNIRLPEVLDEAAAKSLRTEWARVLENAPARINVDFSQVRELGTAGMALLVAFVREVTQQGRGSTILFRGGQPSVTRLWRVIGLGAIVRVEE